MPRAEEEGEDMRDSPRDTSLCEGGVNGRKPSRLLFTAGRLSVGLFTVDPDEPRPRDSVFAELEGEVRVLLEFGGVNGRNPPRFPFPGEDG